MIALIQRVSEARVTVADETVGRIGAGLLAFIAVQPSDGDTQVEQMLERLLKFRIFSDLAGKMNRSLQDIKGGLLLVPQFTLAADTTKGMRPSFTSAANPAAGQFWFNQLVERAQARYSGVEIGRFGAHMDVHLINAGPATFWLEIN